jgi:bloom syndrome protein
MGADPIDLKLGSLRKDYPGVPIMALTATAQDKVQDDIIRSLGIQGCEKLKQSFNRPNLNYEVRPKKKELLKEIVGFIGTQERGASGIIYCSSRDKCEEVAMQLKQTYNIRARHYHAGMPKNDRRAAQEDWQDHKFEIIVATVSYPANMERRS